jgi:UDP-N-acetylglucosamine 2-epimerase
MRSFDRTMPEELNRVLTDHASDLLLCSTETAVRNLEREGAAGETHLVGDVMADVSLAFRDIAEEGSRALEERGLEPGAYLVVTAHRACLLEVPCVTLRDTTEWVETVDAGWNVLVDLDREAALAALERTPPDGRPELYGGGHAAERVRDVVSAYTARR